MEQAKLIEEENKPKKQNWYNTRQVSSLLNLSENIIRKLALEYKPFLTIKKGSKNKNLFNDNSLHLIKKIREMRLVGLKPSLVKKELNEILVKQEKQKSSVQTLSGSELSEEQKKPSVCRRSTTQVKLKDIFKKYNYKIQKLEEDRNNLSSEMIKLREENTSILEDQKKIILDLKEEMNNLKSEIGFFSTIKRWFSFSKKS